MDCPQCGAEVPSDNAFCGKCGYAMRERVPERTDQSRIRVHEEPTPTDESIRRQPSSQRIRKRTVLGMPTATRPAEGPPPPPSGPPPPPTPLSSARPGRSRVSQKTMMGMPRPELLDPHADAPDTDPAPSPSHRARAHVRYDNSLEPPPVTQRRRRALVAVGILVVLSAAWLTYRFLNG